MLKAFLGANTPGGFVSLYDNLLTENKGCKLHILKGGSGSGKSTFIRDIVQRSEQAGQKYEEYHCSSDTNSLDGLYVPALGFAIVDGTSPHVVEPRAYAACDFIINMGDYIDSDVESHLGDINSLRRCKSEKYMAAYSLIGAGGQLQRCADLLIDLSGLDIEKTAKTISDKMNLSSQKKTAFERRMFISALTSSGYVSYVKNLDASNAFTIFGAGDAAGSRILELVRGNLIRCGYTLISFMSPLNDKYLHAIYVEERDFLLISRNFLDEKILTNTHSDELDLADQLSQKQRDVQELNLRSKELYELACDKMQEAALFHAAIEKIYFPYMDFHKLSKMKQEFIAKLFEKV